MTDLPEALPGPTISESPGAVQVVGSSNVHVYVRSGGTEHRLPLTPAVIPLDPTVTSPARILRAGSGVLPFVDRGGLLEKVWAWATGTERFSGCVIGGNAGTGKTRLGIEISERARQAGWITGLLRDKPSDGELEALIELRAKRLIVVDYAELAGELLESLVPLLAHSATVEAPVRVVLLVRAKPRGSDDWREPLYGPRRHGLADLLDRMAVWSLNDQPLDLAERRELFQRSAAGLAARAGRATTPVDPETVDIDPFGDPLSVVIAAYLATHAPEEAVPSTRESLFDALIDNHEQAYWAVSERHPTAHADPHLQESVVALASLTTARTRAEAVEFLRLLPELRDSRAERRASLANWAASLYPTEGFWGALQPDAIGERLIVRCFADQPELLARVIGSDDPVALIRPLRVFARLGLTDSLLRDELGRLVSERLEHLCVLAAKHANEVSRIEELFGTETLAASLDQAASTLPLHSVSLPKALDVLQAAPSLALASLLLALTTEYVNLLRPDAEGAAPAELVDLLATALNNLSNVLDSFGRYEDALEIINEAVTHYRELADDYLPDLAMTLNTQSNGLGRLGRHEDALDAINEAVTHYRTLADARPDDYLPGLATALNNQSNGLGRLGRHEDALDAINEAVTHYRTLADARPDDYLPGLASALNNQSNWLDRLGHHEDALTAIDEAVALRRVLAGARPDAYVSDLASTLTNLASVLGRLGRHEDALEVITEAVTHHYALAEARPDAYLPDLAMALTNQCNALDSLGRREEALEVINEAVTHYRTLADARPDAYLPDLALVLSNQSNGLGRLGRREEALEVINEAVTHYRTLADARPDAYLPDLALVLNNQCNALDSLGRYEDALEAIDEAVALRRTLADARPDAYLPDLASALNNQANALHGLGRHEDALEAINEAVTHYRTLADARPDAYLPALATALNNQSNELNRVGRPKDALEAISEAVALRRALADARPDAYLPALATALHNQANVLDRNGDRTAASRRAEEAARIGLAVLRRSPFALPDRGRLLLENYRRLTAQPGAVRDEELVEALQAVIRE